MNALIQEIISILTVPPGNLTYHVVLAFSVAGALQASLITWRSSQFPQGRRMVIGLSMLLVIRLVLFVMAGLAWQGLINDHILLPPLDRAGTLVGLILIIWMWSFPEPYRLADAAAWLLGFLTLTALALNLVWWTGQGNNLDYNGSWADFIGEIATLVIITLGGLVLLIRKPNGWGFGFNLLLLAAIGHVAYLSLPVAAGDFAGVIRLSQMAYYPLLLVLPQRFPASAPQAVTLAAPPERRRTAVEPKLLQSLLSLGNEDDPGQLGGAITSTISTAILADICLLISPPDPSGDMIVICGYDLIREEQIPGASLSSRDTPLISTALTRGLPLRLPASSTSEDLRKLGDSLHIERPGHFLAAPILSDEGKSLAAIAVLSPYSNRAWSNDDQALLTNLAKPLAQLLQRTQVLASMDTRLTEVNQELEITQAEAQELRNETESLRNQMEMLLEQSEKNRVQAESLAALIADQAEGHPPTEPTLASPAGSKQRSKVMQTKASAAVEPAMEGELRLALEEVARLNADLSDADQRLLAMKNQIADQSPANEQFEEIATIVQEIRQPMASIVGYTDFLLGESTGILGAMQRKFLERVKMLTERMNRLVNELIRMTAAQINGEKLVPEEGIDLYSVVEGAIAESMLALRQKEINLRLEIPENLPAVSVDEDSVKQVLVNLIENAREVTHENGDITLRASLQGNDHQQAYILLQVSDQGGGIPPEYLPRVFSRFGYAEGKPVPGTGGKSSHLSIVKMLVENAGGRIWVDSQINSGATFSILLPVAEETFAEDGP